MISNYYKEISVIILYFLVFKDWLAIKSLKIIKKTIIYSLIIKVLICFSYDLELTRN